MKEQHTRRPLHSYELLENMSPITFTISPFRLWMDAEGIKNFDE